MTPTRRDFIKALGIALASAMLNRCSPAGRATPVPPGTPTGGPEAARERLRQCWQRFDWLAQETRDSWGEDGRGEDALDALVAEHRAALDKLQAQGEVSAAVAENVQDAFAAGAYHVWRANAPMTCYEPMLVDYKPTSSSQLVQQAGLLTEMALTGDLDPDAVARVQAAIERDVAFLTLSSEEVDELYDELMAAAGDDYNFPNFDQLQLEITPEAAEAARFLIDLLLGRSG
jgi:hypothetical protein